jgi:hypothetical protein
VPLKRFRLEPRQLSVSLHDISAMGILDLADELLRIILEHVASEPEKLISLERRAYPSQESFKPHPPPEPDQAQNIAFFRLTCRKFAGKNVGLQF